jgi:ATP-dependent helicase Lhr and Lhr-like helicase
VQATAGWSEWLAELARQRRVALLRVPGTTLWIAAERLPQFRALWPQATCEPAIVAPEGYAERDWSREEALTEILRGRLEGQGPLSEAALAAPLGMEPGDIAAALAALQTEGFALRGRFTPGAGADEWCERRLLARIHHYTVKRLRAEIEPVAARDFLRFLFAWQRVSPDARMEGPDSLDFIVSQLEGVAAAAGAWETEILPTRLRGYEPAWLDDRCLAGRIAWARPGQRSSRANGDRRPAPVRTTPIMLLPRRHAPLWASLAKTQDSAQPSHRAQVVAEHVRRHGASFFDEIVEATGLLRSQVEEALAELVALGLVNSDSFAGLRALLVPSEQRKPAAGARRRRRTALFGIEDAGRWTLARRVPPDGVGAQAEPEAIEHAARALLRRYGVVFWRLLEREADWLPPWRDLLRVFRRLEARGEIRGGRFVSGFSGEQFAVPEAVGMLREIRRGKDSGAFISLSGADPLNLVGILTPGPRLAALTGNRVLYRDGMPVALFAGGEVEFLQTLDATSEWEAHKALLRSADRSAIRADAEEEATVDAA